MAEYPYQAEILATRRLDPDEASVVLGELADHLRGECPADCPRCKREAHTFYAADVILGDPEFVRWEAQALEAADDLAPGGLQGAGPDFALGDLFDRYRWFLLWRNGVNPQLFTPRNVVGRNHMAKKKPPARRRPAARKPKPVELTLPTEPSRISADLDDYSFFVHGQPLIGKTTLATAEGDVFVMSFDPIRPGLSIIQEHMRTWDTLRKYLKALEAAVAADAFPYDRLVIDRIDLGYVRCTDWICKKRGIEHPSDEGFARAWHALRDEYVETILRLMAMPCGTWFICHSKWKEVKSRAGVVTERLVPDLSDRAEEILNGLTDGGFAYDWEGGERVIIVQGDASVTAGHNLDTAFKTPDGRTVVEVPAGNSALEAWTNFKAAFNNQQTFVDLKERDEAIKPARRKRSKKKTTKRR